MLAHANVSHQNSDGVLQRGSLFSLYSPNPDSNPNLTAEQKSVICWSIEHFSTAL